MLVQYFMRIPEFQQVPPQELRALAARSHVLCVPGGRWLLREGRQIDGYFYLLKGSVETRGPQRKWRARGYGRLQHFYPGCAAVRTLGGVQVLRIDSRHRDFLVQGGSMPPVKDTTADPWLSRFLNSHMMHQLTPAQWQEFMAAFQCYEFAAGARILSQGEPGRHCFVMEAGHAIVQRAGQTLGHLCPGDFFGEDALMLDSGRNADVTALEDVRAHAIEQQVFSRVLEQNLVQFVRRAGRGEVLCLHGNGDTHISLSNIREQAAQLDPRATYYVAGGHRRERALATLILVQRGCKALALED